MNTAGEDQSSSALCAQVGCLRLGPSRSAAGLPERARTAASATDYVTGSDNAALPVYSGSAVAGISKLRKNCHASGMIA